MGRRFDGRVCEMHAQGRLGVDQTRSGGWKNPRQKDGTVSADVVSAAGTGFRRLRAGKLHASTGRKTGSLLIVAVCLGGTRLSAQWHWTNPGSPGLGALNSYPTIFPQQLIGAWIVWIGAFGHWTPNGVSGRLEVIDARPTSKASTSSKKLFAAPPVRGRVTRMTLTLYCTLGVGR